MKTSAQRATQMLFSLASWWFVAIVGLLHAHRAIARAGFIGHAPRNEDVFLFSVTALLLMVTSWRLVMVARTNMTGKKAQTGLVRDEST